MPSITGTTTAPCICCTASLPTECRHDGGITSLDTTVLCSTRGGTATMCGHNEFTSPSLPPKKYRGLSQTGGITFKYYSPDSPGGPSCTGLTVVPDVTCNWSGTCSYNVSTCSYTETGSQECGAAPVSNCGDLGADTSLYSVSQSRTRRWLTLNGGCVLQGSPLYYVAAVNNTVTVDLYDEDRETDAQARSTPAGWSSYGGCSAGLPCCEASRSTRGTGVFTFSYAEAKAKVIFTGLPAGASATIRLTIHSRNLTTLATALHSVLAAGVTASGSGAGEHIFDIPNPASGFATYAQALNYEITDPGTAPATWDGCTDLADGWAGQLYTESPEALVYNFVQHRATWPGAVPGQTRTVRFYWETTAWGGDTWSEDGFTDASVVGVSLPALSQTVWVDVPNEEGFHTRLIRARLLP